MIEDKQKDNEQSNSRIESLEKEVHDMREILSAAIEKLDGVPSKSEAGFELPITRFEADKNFKWQRDGVNLTLMLNTDKIKKDMAPAPGGGGAPGYPVPCLGGDVTQVGDLGEGLEAANEDSFVHDKINGCLAYVMTRVFYDHAATPAPILYGYQRPMIFDIEGRLCQIGIEERYIIDEPEECVTSP